MRNPSFIGVSLTFFSSLLVMPFGGLLSLLQLIRSAPWHQFDSVPASVAAVFTASGLRIPTNLLWRFQSLINILVWFSMVMRIARVAFIVLIGLPSALGLSFIGFAYYGLNVKPIIEWTYDHVSHIPKIIYDNFKGYVITENTLWYIKAITWASLTGSWILGWCYSDQGLLPYIAYTFQCIWDYSVYASYSIYGLTAQGLTYLWNSPWVTSLGAALRALISR